MDWFGWRVACLDGAVEVASSVDHVDHVAELLVATCGVEASLFADDIVEQVEGAYAPAGRLRSGHSPAGDVEVDRCGVREHRCAERVRVALAVGGGRDPGGRVHLELVVQGGAVRAGQLAVRAVEHEPAHAAAGDYG